MKTKISNEFILAAHKEACSEWKQKIEEQAPDLFKSKLEIGKWYKEVGNNDYLRFLIEENKNGHFNAYGFYGSTWVESDSFFAEGMIEATKEEVETALIAEAKNRGFKGGVHINEIRGSRKGVNEFKLTMNPDFNVWTHNLGGQCIFSEGKWATIIEQEITTEELLKMPLSEALENHKEELYKIFKS